MPVHPVIVLGMERSGTTLLINLLARLGLFIGERREENDEALFFWRINRWIFKEVNATWDNPYNFQFLDPQTKSEIVRVAQQHLHSFRAIEYLGLRRYLQYRSIRQVDFPWGWKDPKNTFTVDVWREIFPQAHLVHIYRNPVDVMHSLDARSKRQRKNFRRTATRWLKEQLLVAQVSYSTKSVRLLDPYERFKLWDQYVQKALALSQMGSQSVLHIQYEKLLEDPAAVLADICSFIGLDVVQDTIAHQASLIKPERRYAFLSDERLLEFYNSIRDHATVKRLGYDTLA